MICFYTLVFIIWEFYPIRAFRAYPLIEIRQAAPCRAIRGSSFLVNSTLAPSHQEFVCRFCLCSRCGRCCALEPLHYCAWLRTRAWPTSRSSQASKSQKTSHQGKASFGLYGAVEVLGPTTTTTTTTTTMIIIMTTIIITTITTITTTIITTIITVTIVLHPFVILRWNRNPRPQPEI